MQINFTGNQIFSDDQLLNAMQLEVGTNVNGSLNLSIHPDEIKKGTDQVRQFLKERGYLISQVGDPRLERSNKGLTVIIPITEGPLYRIGRVRFEDSAHFSEEQLLEIFPIKEGEIATSFSTKVPGGIERLQRIYSNHGYLNFTIIPTQDMNDDEGILDCTFRLEEGPVFFIRRITLVGSSKTNERVLRSEFLIREGQSFSQQLLEESLSRVHQLGLTEEIKPDSVSLQIDAVAHQVDVTINVKEGTQVPKP